jgi:chromosome transmission fidelity protein 18
MHVKETCHYCGFLFTLQLNLSTDWLCFVDGVMQYTQHKQDYSLMKYVPFLPVAFHMMYAAFVPPHINFPHVQFEVRKFVLSLFKASL